MALRQASKEEEDVEEEEEEGDDDDEEDDDDDDRSRGDESGYSYDGGDDHGDDEGGRETDYALSGSSDEESAGGCEHRRRAPEPAVRHAAKLEAVAAWPPAAPPPSFSLPTRRSAAGPLSKRFVSASLPGSRSSSPRAAPPSGAELTTGFRRWGGRPSRRYSTLNPLSRRRTLVRSQPSAAGDAHMGRSKSCGERRASLPPDELEIWPRIVAPEHQAVEDGVLDHGGDGGRPGEMDPGRKPPQQRSDDGFKCGAFCMFLPGFSKAKQVQPRKEGGADDGRGAAAAAAVARMSVASKAASLERFECGSWSSSIIVGEGGDDEEIPPSYFDLPLELMRGGADDTDSPVRAAFVFDRERRPGVLKKSSFSKGARAGAPPPRRSHDLAGRHVTFSAAPPGPSSQPTSPTAFCVSPRLRQARGDFNAFLEAQNA